MSLIIPNTFATKDGSIQLSLLDDNFTYVKTQVDPYVNTIILNGSNVSLPGNLTLTTGNLTLNTGNLTLGLGSITANTLTATTLSANSYVLSDTIGTIKINGTNRIPRLICNGWEFEIADNIFTPIGRNFVDFNYTGVDQSYTVPLTNTFIYVKMWGAGGGHGRASGWSYGSDAGGGGHSRGLIPVTSGETLTVRVGAGGRTAVNASSFGGGGGALNATDTSYGGQGGGGAYIFRSTTPLLIAGGGGGGGASRSWTGNIGGAGGGLIGQKGESPYDAKSAFGGTGGTQLAGGTASSGGSGSLYQGGTSGTNSYGGGGGGGYYGGGGGGYSESNTMAGGGGGSGYVNPLVLLGGTFTGNFRVPAMSHDPILPQIASNYTNVAYGCQNLQNNIAANVLAGGNAFIRIYY